jgi:ketosteroid isomerase-like protein
MSRATRPRGTLNSCGSFWSTRESVAAAGLSALLLLVVLCGCTVWKEKKPSAWTDITGGESMERVFWRQVKAKDWAGVEQHLAGNYVYASPSGVYDAAEAIERWKHLQIDDYSLGDFHVQLSGNAYIVTYTVTVRGNRAGQPLPSGPFRAMTVWQQVARNWVAIAHSIAPLAPSTGK